MKRLTLLRHAKSSWKDPYLGDFDRPLNKRGKRAAPEMGRRLAERGNEPDLIVSSPAKRALRTARLVADELDYPRDMILEEEDIYEAATGTLLEIVQALDDDAQHILLVGHNPGFTDLANLLADAGIGNVPTAGVVEIEFPVDSWHEVSPGSGDLLRFDFPKNEPEE